MGVFIIILVCLFLLPFWAAVLSFCPIMIYLIFNPLYSIVADKALKRKIFLLREAAQLRTEKRKRIRGVLIIYAVCLWLMGVVCFINWIREGHFSIQPFDILSSASAILFCFAVVSYLPFAAYLIIKEPWKYKEEGAIFTRIFMIYGIAILAFSFVYFGFWTRAHDIFWGVGDFLRSAFVFLFSAVMLSYLPSLIYVFSQIKNPFRKGRIKLKVVFFIYCICFVLFSVIYVVNWYSDRKTEGRPRFLQSVQR